MWIHESGCAGNPYGRVGRWFTTKIEEPWRARRFESIAELSVELEESASAIQTQRVVENRSSLGLEDKRTIDLATTGADKRRPLASRYESVRT